MTKPDVIIAFVTEFFFVCVSVYACVSDKERFALRKHMLRNVTEQVCACVCV